MESTHGGKRKGSGRKKLNTIAINFKVPKTLVDSLATKMTARERNLKIIEFLQKLDK